MRFYLLVCLAISYLSTFAQLSVIIDAWPANTPMQDNLYIAGDFQGWDAGSSAHILPFNSDADHYAIHLPNHSGSIQFKFTRGSWDTVEGDEQGNFIPNRSYSTSAGDTLFLQIAGWEDLDGGMSGQSTAAENVSILSTYFPMTALNTTRRVWLYLPPDYTTSNRNYPVLYMQDGQNVFDASTSFSGEWEVDETLNMLFAQGDPGIIVVAVDNGGGERIAEYTPWSNPTYGGGDGNEYVDFLVNDLKPYIDANYRTLSDRNHTAVMGSSLGGLISAYAALSRPDIFGKVGSLSPAYWINREDLTNYVSEVSSPLPLRLHQIIGTPEGSTFVQDMFDFQQNLVEAGYQSDEIRSIQHADGAHSEWYWAREFGAVYQWLFPAPTNSIKFLDSSALQYRQSPNPNSGQLHISFHLEQPDIGQITLYNSSGQSFSLIDKKSFPTGDQELHLDLSALALPQGHYWVHLQLRDGLLVQPLFVR
ncbi:MAG: alpha/beta hydrolase-fold protein [Bacteroidota bacterium]